MTLDGKELRWPTAKLTGDYVRGIVGLCIVLLCTVLAPPGSWWQILLVGFLFLFLAFLSDVLIRHGTRIIVSSEGLVRRRPLWGEDAVPWAEIQGLDVRFYPTRKGAKIGWMTAKVKGPRGVITLDDGMEGFEDVMDKAMQALDRRGLGLSETTMANLSSLGLGLRPRTRK